MIWKATEGDLAFNMSGGAFTVGSGTATLVSDGSLVIDSPSAVQIGDVITSQEFTILSSSGQILLTGTAYYAGGISFQGANATVQTPGGETVVFGTASGAVDAEITSLSNPVSTQVLSPEVLDPSGRFILSSILGAGTTFEISLSTSNFLRRRDEIGADAIGNSDVASYLSGSMPSPQVEVAPQASITQTQREQMALLGIYARPMTSEEDRKRLFAHGVYRQLIADATASPDKFQVADARLSAAAVQAALDQYDSIFTTSSAGATSSRGAELTQLLTEAYYRYAGAIPDAEPAGFRAYLLGNRAEADNARVLDLLGQLGVLFRRIERLGLTARELEISKTKVLQELQVPGIPPPALRAIVDESRPPSGPTVATSDRSARKPRG